VIALKSYLEKVKHHKLTQGVLLTLYILVTSLSLYLAQKSVIAFLLLLSSLLLLHFTKLGYATKWVVAGLVLVVLLPLSASQGMAYQSYMEVVTLVGIYVAMALGMMKPTVFHMELKGD
jgi:branched-chain amino acid transport system permease protein